MDGPETKIAGESLPDLIGELVAILLIVGLPICWVEWTLGRFGGTQGYNSSPHSVGGC